MKNPYNNESLHDECIELIVSRIKEIFGTQYHVRTTLKHDTFTIAAIIPAKFAAYHETTAQSIITAAFGQDNISLMGYHGCLTDGYVLLNHLDFYLETLKICPRVACRFEDPKLFNKIETFVKEVISFCATKPRIDLPRPLSPF